MQEPSIQPIISTAELVKLLSLIQNSNRIVICGHRNPDGDAIGSTLGMCQYLRKLKKRANVIVPSPYPDFLKWIPDVRTVLIYERSMEAAKQMIEEADLIFCMDFNELQRLGDDMAKEIRKAKAKRVLIDHHMDPETDVADIIISRPEKSSTSEMTFRLIEQLGGFDDMGLSGAIALYTGMMTDTGGFTYNSKDPEIYFIIWKLLTKGIDKDKIYRNVFNNYSESRLRLQGYLLYEKLQFLCDKKAAYYTLTREEMKRFNFIRGDAEGFVNLPLQVKGMRLSISLREDTEKDVVRVSLRSYDDFSCKEMAERFFNGGGHFNASGGQLPFPMEEAVETVKKAIEAYKDQLLKAPQQP